MRGGKPVIVTMAKEEQLVDDVSRGPALCAVWLMCAAAAPPQFASRAHAAARARQRRHRLASVAHDPQHSLQA